MHLAAILAVALAAVAPGCSDGRAARDAGGDALLVQAIPLTIYSRCSSDPGPVNDAQHCLHARVTSGGQTLLAEWTICGSELCDAGEGYGLGPAGTDGTSTRPVLFRCLPDPGAAIQIDVCVPGYAPLGMTIPPTPLATPARLAIRARNLEACTPGALDYVVTSYRELQASYELQPQAGGTACPLAPGGGQPPPALLCPCPP